MRKLSSAIAAVMLLLTAAAHADISGTFSGIVTSSEFYFGGGSLNGDLATGSFVASANGCTVGGDNVCGGAIASVSVSLGGYNLSFGAGGSGLSVQNTATQQQLDLLSGFMNPYVYAFLDLLGGPNAFLSGDDFSTLHPAPVLSGSADFFNGRDFQFSLGSVDYAVNGITVPEPHSLAMFVTGLVGLALGVGVSGRRRRARLVA